jgi:hypothetical protein
MKAEMEKAELRDCLGRRLNPRWRFPGLMRDAAALGVNRTHLYLVLAGKRESRSLRARYAELKRAAGPQSRLYGAEGGLLGQKGAVA